MNKQERGLKETELTEMEESFFKNTSITATNLDKDKWQVEKNSSSKRTAGRFTFDRREQKPIKIEISWDFLHHPKPNVIKDILFHELIHYLLCMLGKPFDDKDEVFQLELQKHGVPSVLDTGKRYEYVCEYGI